MSLEQIEQVKKKIDDTNEEIKRFARENGGTAFKEAFKVIFETSPIVQISWTQFTPHFNDGDVCEFGVNDPGLYLATDDLNESPYEFDIPNVYYNNAVKNWEITSNARYIALGGKEAINTFRSIWRAIPRELFEAVFGDGVLVKITKDGITVEKYRHD